MSDPIDRAIGGTTLDRSVKALQDVFVDHDTAEKREPMSDTISRQAAIKALADDMPQTYTPDGSHYADDDIFKAQEIYADCIQRLEELPSAQPDVPERNVGKWIKVGDNSYMCSVCGEVSCCNGNFCPDCGVDMRERRTDDCI